MTVLVGGGAADVEDVVNGIGAEFPRTALFILITTYLVLFLLLRSVFLPLKALVMNALSILASFGALVWIFQTATCRRSSEPGRSGSSRRRSRSSCSACSSGSPW